MKKPKPKPAPKGWTNYVVELPSSVIAIVEAAGGADPSKGGMPFAMASIVGALPWIAVAVYKSATAEEYAQFAEQLKANMQMVWTIAGAFDPEAAFEAAFDRAKKSLQ